MLEFLYTWETSGVGKGQLFSQGFINFLHFFVVGGGRGGDKRSTWVQFSGGVATCTPVHAYLKNVLNIDKKQKQK